MVRPRALKPGDRLAVVAPASQCSREEFDGGIDELRRLGFVPVFDDSVFARETFTAGPAELRADAILRAWQDPSITGLIAVRGGYGSSQVLPLLDRDEARRRAQPFMVTAIDGEAAFLTVNCGVVAFHGPMSMAVWHEVPRSRSQSFLKAVCRPNRWAS
jgi:muramoyltetrapeptide carboxypeptidase